MSRPRTNRRTDRAVRIFAGAVALGVTLAACSDIYIDRRETVGLSAGDAVAANEITQMVDPWPPNSGNNHIAYNGQRMQAAVERYRNNRVIPPVNATTSVIEAPPSEAPAAASTGMPNATAGTPAAATAATTQ
jgi:hypothetical protein